MSVDIRSSERRRYMSELQAREKEIAAGLLKASQPASPKAPPESDKRVRREIANSNERRRMQCINAGFSNLRSLIPQLEGEKLSKAAILQHTTEYISSLVKEKSRLQVQLELSNQHLAECGHDRMITDAAYVANSPPPSKRKKRDTESSDEGVGSLSDASDEGSAELRQENAELRHQLDAERQKNASLEKQNRILETQLLSLINSAPQQNIRELQPVKVEAAFPPVTESWPMYSREVVEVIGEDKSYLPPPRPLSPTPERGMAMEVGFPSSECQRFLEQVPCDPAHQSVNMEEVERPQLIHTPLTSLPVASTPPMVVPASTEARPVETETSSPHHHNYCHRDHPRRRLRKKAQLEQQQAEEEARRREQEQQLQLQQQQTLAAYRPKPSAQNLENLVEAIRQIEGDRILCQIEGERGMCDERRLYEEEERLYTQRKSILSADESERETTSISDLEELRVEHPSSSSGGESPLQHSSYLHQSHLPLPPTISQLPLGRDVIPVTIPASSSSASLSQSSTSSSSFSEKYPIASHLLHRPLNHSLYRPGVIIQKQ